MSSKSGLDKITSFFEFRTILEFSNAEVPNFDFEILYD